MSKLYAKYDNSGTWTVISGARDIKVTRAMNYKDDCKFMLPNYFNEVYSTWEARIDTGIQIWIDTDTDFLIFEGQITHVITGDPIEIKCSGILDKLDWYGIPEGSTKFKLDEVVIKSVPAADPSVFRVQVLTEEGEVPDWNETDYLGKFVIISDATLQESNAVMLSEAGSSVVNEASEDNAHGDTQTDGDTSDEAGWEANCWIVERDKTTHNTENPTKMIIALDAVNDTITKASDVTKIKIEMKGRIRQSAYGAWLGPFTMICGWSIDGVTIDIPLFTVTSPKGDVYSAVSQEFSFIGEELVIIVEPETTDQYFNEGANFWEDGYIILQMDYLGTILGTTRDISHKIYLNYCKVTTYYNSETFDAVSGRISALSETVNEFSIFALDVDGNAIDFTSRGFAVSDRVTIAENVNIAFQKCLVGPLADKPELVIPENIHKGIANEYFGITGHKLFITICNYMGYSYWASYDGDLANDGLSFPRIVAKLESDVDNVYILGDVVAGVAGDVITLTTATSFAVDELNGLEVYVTAGEQIGETFIISDTAANGNITLSTTPNANLNGDTVNIQYPERIYDPSNNPPEDLAVVEAQNNTYGGVVVYCNAGVTDIIRSGAAPYNDKIKVIVRKDILTIQEAREVGARWALVLKTRRLSVNLKWTYLPTEFPVPGKLYTYNGRKWDGTDHTTVEAFTDEICRRVTVSQDGAAGMWEINGYFGGGSTPVDEALGKAIGDLRVINILNQATSMTAPVTGAKRHAQLDGITATDHHTSRDADLMIGEANAQKVPCIVQGVTNPTLLDTGSDVIQSLGTGNFWVGFTIPFPMHRGGLNLYVKSIFVEIHTADATDYLTRIRYFAWSDYDTSVTELSDATDRTAGGSYEYAVNQNMSPYQAGSIFLDCVAPGGAFELLISSVLAEIYYV